MPCRWWRRGSRGGRRQRGRVVVADGVGDRRGRHRDVHGGADVAAYFGSAGGTDDAAGTDLSVSADVLTFTALNWSTAQTVSVTVGQDDDAVDGEVTLTHTASGVGYDAVEEADVVVTVDDDETAGLVLSPPSSLTVAEGGDADYTVALSSEPTTTVTVTIGGVSDTDLSLDVTRLAFTTSNWSTGKTVTVSAGEDDDGLDDTATLTHRASGGDYEGLTGLAVTVDDDAPVVTLALSPSSVSEDGGVSTVTATLNHASSEAVVVAVSAAADSPAVSGDFMLSANKVLTIAAGSTSSTGVVTLTAVNNPVDSPDNTVTVSATVSGGKGASAPASVKLTIEDDDATPTVTLTLSPESVSEDGGVSTVTAALSRASSEAVAVAVTAAPRSLRRCRATSR